VTHNRCEQLEGQIERSAQSHVAVVHERVEVPEMPVMGMQTSKEKRVHSSGLSLEVEGIFGKDETRLVACLERNLWLEFPA